MDYSNMTNEQLEELAKNGEDGEAICELAERYLDGLKGQIRKPQRAYRYFHKAERLGMKRAYLGLAKMYENGIYFAQNTELANDYYAKAGGSLYTGVSDNGNVGGGSSGPFDIDRVKKLICDADNARKQDCLEFAEEHAKQALDLINRGRRSVSSSANDELDELEIDVYWTLAYIAFNKENYQEMDMYLGHPGVDALHPWGVYLAAMTHKANGAPIEILEQDMEHLLMVKQNSRLTTEERGDLLGQIADFYLEGLNSHDGDTVKLAYEYYIQAAQCGNTYAAEQAGRFKKSLTGGIKYRG